MKRTIVLVVLLISFGKTVIAQKKVIAQGTYPSLFIKHKVVAGETFYSISKLYNLNTAQFTNQQNNTSSLSIGALVSIPLDNNNFTQDGQSAEEQTLVPIYHIVQKGETLFRISQDFGKIRIDFLREWNDLNNDYIQVGQKVIVGHLKIDKTKVGDVLERTFYDGKDEGTTNNGGTVKVETTKNNETNTTTEESEGFFVKQFPTTGDSKNFITRTGDAAIFKSTSGWTDKKYYVLMNNITPGSIVRITTNVGKSICAKVLGSLPEMKENSNLILRLSNAAASVLKVADKKFSVKVTFYNN